MAEQGGCHVWCGHGSAAAGWTHGPWCGVPGPDLSPRLRAHASSGRAGRHVPARSSGDAGRIPAVIEQIGTRFRQAVARFAENNDIPMVKFRKGIRKIDVMRPLLARAACTGRPQVVAVGWAQEFQHVWDARKRDTDPARPPQFSYAMAERRVTCYYFYVWDKRWGAGFIKICAYFPYPAKVWVNGHEWAKRQAARAGI